MSEARTDEDRVKDMFEKIYLVEYAARMTQSYDIRKSSSFLSTHEAVNDYRIMAQRAGDCPMSPLTHQPTRAIASGCIWPLGRSHARDVAQVRQCERDLESITDAATVAA